jgi:hypothetical protein
MGGPAVASAAPERPLGMPATIAAIALALASVAVGATSVLGLIGVPYSAVGVLLVIRRPRNPIGWLLLGIGWVLALLLVTLPATPQGFRDGTLPPVLVGTAWLLSAGGSSVFLLYAVLMMVFPSGRFPGGRLGTVARGAVWLEAVVLLVLTVQPAINVSLPGYSTDVAVPNPLALAPDAGIWTYLNTLTTTPVAVGVMVVAALSLVVRYRRAGGIEREQLRWIGAAVIALVGGVLGGFVLGRLFPEQVDTGYIWVPAMMAYPTIPAAIGIAVLRYRLYEIDRIISRTLGYAIVTIILGATFAALVVGLQTLALPITGGSELLVAGSTLVVAALFGPVRSRVQRTVDQRFDRARYDAALVAAGFGVRLRNRFDLEAVRGELTRTAGASLNPATISVWVRPRPEGHR